jgi:hypothetical protein
MKWDPISRGKPRVRGVNPQDSGLIDVEIDLSITPPPEWAQAFTNPPDVPISMGMHPPTLSGPRGVELQLPDGELEAYVANIDARIAAANDYFERQVLPSLMAAEASAQRDEASAQARVDDVQRRAENL